MTLVGYRKLPCCQDSRMSFHGCIKQLAGGLAIRGCDTQAPNIALTGVIFLQHLAKGRLVLEP